MLQKRRPLEVLDANKQHGLKRVQPYRAAKSSHKWLSSRTEDEYDDSVSNFGCNRMQEEIVDGESLGETILLKNDTMLRTKSERLNNKDPHRAYRFPLLALSVPSMKLFGPLQFGRIHLAAGCQNSFFPPMPKSSKDSEDNSIMCVGDDTAPETSLIDCGESDDAEKKHAVFFSYTQSNVPFAYSQSKHKHDSSKLGKFKVATHGPFLRREQNLDALDEYFPDILTYMREADSRYRPRPDFIRKQPEISSSMRTKLVDWLIEVQDEYKLENETVSLAVAYSDRFLSSMSVARSKLQLLGATAMFVASKYEEIYPPDVNEFAYITAETYSTADVIAMERLLLKVLGTTMAVPTSLQFLGLLLHNSTVSYPFRLLATFLAELTMLFDQFHNYSCSVLAAASISVAHYLAHSSASKVENGSEEKTGQNNPATDCFNFLDFECELSSVVQSYMEDSHDEIFACSLELLMSHRNIKFAPEQFVREKYLRKRNRRVALIPSPVGEASSISTSAEPATTLHRDDILAIWTRK